MKKRIAFLLIVAVMNSLVCYAYEPLAEEQEVILEDEIQRPEAELDIIPQDDSLLLDNEETLDLLPETDIDLDELLSGGEFSSDSSSYDDEAVSIEVPNGPVTQAVGNGFYWPMVTHTKSSGFMPYRETSFGKGAHLALDIYSNKRDLNLKIGSPVYPIYDGDVIEIVPNGGANSGHGNYVRLRHEIDGFVFYSQYQHLYECEPLEKGQKVFGGKTKLGVEGGTGGNYKPHLHLIVWSIDEHHPWAGYYELINYNFEDPDTNEPIHYEAKVVDGKLASISGIINSEGEYIYHPYYYVEWNYLGEIDNERYKVKLYNPWDILNGKYVPGEERKKVKTITLNKTKVTLNISKKDTAQLTANTNPNDAAYKDVKWTSANTAIATVSEEGFVTPVSIGETDIICEAKDGGGAKASCHIKIIKLELNADNLDMYIGQTFTLKGKIDGKSVSCSFKSSNSKVVAVDKKGKITANSVKKLTKVTITATAPNDQGTELCTVIVHPKPTSAQITQGKAKTIYVGDTLTLNVVFEPEKALAPVTFVSSNNKVAKVQNNKDGSCIVKALSEGEATITAEIGGFPKFAKENKNPTFKVSVKHRKASLEKATITVGSQVYTGKAIKPTIKVVMAKKTLKKGTDYSVSYKNNKNIGTATVTVTGKGSYTGTKKATFSINPKAVTGFALSAGDKQITTSWKKVTGVTGYWIQYDVKKDFRSSNNVTIKNNSTKNVIKGLSAGETYYARIRSYKTVNKKKFYSAWSGVKKAKTSGATGTTIQLDKESLSLNVGDTYQLTCFVTEGVSGSVQFSSSNAAVATVDAEALITAVGVGEATITASMDNGATATCEVTVSNSGVPTSIKIDDGDTLTLSVGQTYKLKAVLEPSTSTAEIHWMVDRDYRDVSAFWTDFLTVSADGVITALKEGTIPVFAMTKGVDNKTLQDKIQVTIVPSNGVTQLYSDGILKLLGVINEHRENNTHMLTINPDLCELAKQQLENKLNGGSITLASGEYGWYYHSDYSTSSDGDDLLYAALNMIMDTKSSVRNGFCDPKYHEIGIATQFQSPWWEYGFYVLR